MVGVSCISVLALIRNCQSEEHLGVRRVQGLGGTGEQELLQVICHCEGRAHAVC